MKAGIQRARIHSWTQRYRRMRKHRRVHPMKEEIRLKLATLVHSSSENPGFVFTVYTRFQGEKSVRKRKETEKKYGRNRQRLPNAEKK